LKRSINKDGGLLKKRRILEHSIADAQKLKRTPWRIASLMVECREIEENILEHSIDDGRMFKNRREIFGAKQKKVECWKSARQILEGGISDGRIFESWLGLRAQQR